MLKNKELIAKIIIAIITIIIAFQISFRPIDNSDFGFHLRTGQDIVKNHRFPLNESYSYTAKGNFNPLYSWIFDSLSYIAYKTGGLDGLIYLQMIFVFIIYVLIFFALYKSSIFSQNFLLAVPAAINIILAMTFLLIPRIMTRPHLMGFVFLALFLVVLDYAGKKYRESDNLRYILKNKGFTVLLIIFLFWVNSHSSFAEGFAVLCIWAAAQAVKNAKQSEKRMGINGLAGLLLLFAILVFCTPNLYRIFEAFVSTTKSTQEFYSLFEIFPVWGFFYTAIILVYVLGFAVIAAYYFKLRDYYRAIAIIFFAAIGLYSVRFLGELGVAAAVLSIPAANEFIKNTGLKPKLNKIMISIFILLALGQAALVIKYHKANGLGIDSKKLPVYSTAYIQKLNLDGNMFNYFGWGGYFIWKMQDHPVFIDGRVQVYPDDFLYKCAGMLRKPPDFFNEQCEKYGISFAIIPYASNIGGTVMDDFADFLFNNNGWALVYFDNNSMVYLKRGFSPKNDAIIARDEYTMLQPSAMALFLKYRYFISNEGRQALAEHLQSSMSGYPDCLQNEAQKQKLIAELQRSIAGFPDCIYSHFCLAYIYFRLGNNAEATKEMETTVKLAREVK